MSTALDFKYDAKRLDIDEALAKHRSQIIGEEWAFDEDIQEDICYIEFKDGSIFIDHPFAV